MRKTTIEGNMTPVDRRLVEIGMTRAALARMSGVPLRTLENWSNRTIKSPNVYQFYRVAKVLGCSMEDLLEPELLEDGQQEDAASEAQKENPEATQVASGTDNTEDLRITKAAECCDLDGTKGVTNCAKCPLRGFVDCEWILKKELKKRTQVTE